VKVIFVFPDLNVFQEFSRDYSGIFAHGIGYLCSSLKKRGHTASLVHLVKEISNDIFLQRIREEEPALIAFTSFSHQFEYVKRLAALLKTAYQVPVICGGVHATIDPDEVINAEGIDMICRGEGEYALAELCDKLANKEAITTVKNIWLKENGVIIRNDVRPLEYNLDALPFPDRKLFSYRTLSDYKIRMISILASRGCPYHCSYCCNHQYQKLYPHKYVRFRSVDNVLAEIQEVLKWYTDAEFVNFIDDTLCLNREWMEEFCSKFPSKIGLPFHGNTRANLLDEEMVALLKKGGCERLDVGIEAGNAHIRQQVLRRNITEEQIHKAFELGRKYNIKLAAYNMLGCPFETPQMILETIKINTHVMPYASHNAIYQPYPNTELQKVCLDKGYISGKELSAFFKESVLDQPQLGRRQVIFFKQYFLILMKLYKFSSALPQKIADVSSRVIDKSAIRFSNSHIALKLHPLFCALFLPVRTAKLLVMIINPRLARALKHIIFGRYYMKGDRTGNRDDRHTT
jgi:radical SAM superfamily enzyme YgiQ (UPF0313 family)